MPGFYCTPSPFLKLNIKVVFISLFLFLFPSFPPLMLYFLAKNGPALLLSHYTAMTFGCQFFFLLWMVFECRTIPLIAPILLSWLSHPSSCLPTQPWKPSHPGLSTYWWLADPQGCVLIPAWPSWWENKAVFDRVVIQPFCLQLDFGHGGLVDASFASFRILHQPGADEKKAKGSPELTPRHALILHDPGNAQTWAETLLVCPVIPFFLQCSNVSLILEVRNYFGWHWFWFSVLSFLCFGGHKNLHSCKITYWMTFISFIF